MERDPQSFITARGSVPSNLTKTSTPSADSARAW
jgi:hypothetical protein